jgi:hypothetical protein
LSYISTATKKERKSGVSAHSAKKRNIPNLKQCVKEYVEKKFSSDKVVDTRKQLANVQWEYYLAVGNVRFPEELEIFKENGINILKIKGLLDEFQNGTTEFLIKKAKGSDLVDLMFARDNFK